jgi:thioredoxin-dependent peroxiredoxin
MLIDVGNDAPDFLLKTSTGEDFRLSDLQGSLRVMLVFYPKDFTPGCTDQLIQVRKNITHMREAGLEPVGVNPGDAETHQRFREAHALNFELLVDEGSEVAKAYGAIKPEGEGIQRSVVIVGRNGKVIFAKEGAPAWQQILNATRDMTEDIDAPVKA